ncbi:MAG: hypothetical protein NT027_11275 [Proteobacteria bacterium]|nr:hypothetical protein [Pseudomonadota bacterium]
MPDIDWLDIYRRVVLNDGHGAIGNRDVDRVISEIIGNQTIAEMIEHSFTTDPSAELTIRILMNLRSKWATDYCYRIYTEDENITRKRSSVELLSSIAHESAFPWAFQFLDDEDLVIQRYGARLVQVSIEYGLIDPDQCKQIFKKMEGHHNKNVRSFYQGIQEQLLRNDPL